jgi:integrase
MDVNLEFNYKKLKLMAALAGRSVNDYVVLSGQNDPFFVGSKTRIQMAEWFAGLWNKMGYADQMGVHLRRIHYKIVSVETAKPNGELYKNTENDWSYLVNASKYARYLQMVDPARFDDRRNARPIVNSLLIHNIHPFLVEQYKKIRKDQGAEIATINRDTATLRNMLNKAVEWKYISVNPIKAMKQMKEDNERTWVLTPDEETRILEIVAAKRQQKKYLKDLVLFALHSGMRQDEIFGLKKCNVDMDNRFILVEHTKTGKNRKVPVNQTLTDILERRIKDDSSEHVFSNAKGERLRAITSAWESAVKDAGLIRWNGGKEIRFRFHDLRHTFGSRLGMKGYGLKTIMEIMGHVNPKTAMRYQHPTAEHKLEAVKSLDQVPPKVTPSKIFALNSVAKSGG